MSLFELCTVLRRVHIALTAVQFTYCSVNMAVQYLANSQWWYFILFWWCDWKI